MVGDMETKLWQNGDAYAVQSPHGFYIGANAARRVPEWAKRAPDIVFGDEVEWNGGECPVDPGQMVLCRWRSGGYYYGPSNPHPALWHHAPSKFRPNPAGDVIAYQVAI